MDALLTIGEFSKMTYLSVKALRHYHDVGLLEPVDIDSATGYRRYSTAQVSTAQAIRRFRELDMPIEHVRAVLDAPDVTSRNEAILVHLRHMQQQLERTQTTVASLQALLEDVRRTSTVTRRSIGPTSSLAISETVAFDDTGEWCGAAFDELHGELAGAGLAPAGPDGALYFGDFFELGLGKVVAFVPISRRHAVRLVEPNGSNCRPPISRCWSTRDPSPISTARTARSAHTSRSSASVSTDRSVSTTSWPATTSIPSTTAPRSAGRSSSIQCPRRPEQRSNPR